MSFKILRHRDGKEVLEFIEYCGRLTHRSKSTGNPEEFVKKLIEWGHESVLEHGDSPSVEFHISRGAANQLVRHRLASYVQESTRYIKYDNLEFADETTEELFGNRIRSEYKRISNEQSPEAAREILPLSTMTTIIVTANLREWRHIFKLRTSKHAHVEIRTVMRELLNEFKKIYPVIFDDIIYK